MKNINIRFEDSTHALVKEAAEEDRRSFNSEVQWLLIFALAQRVKAGQSDTGSSSAKR